MILAKLFQKHPVIIHLLWPVLTSSVPKQQNIVSCHRSFLLKIIITLDLHTKRLSKYRSISLVTKYGFSEFAYVIPNKAAYMDDETWSKVVKVVAPGIQKWRREMLLFNLFYFLLIKLYIYVPKIICRWFVTSNCFGFHHIWWIQVSRRWHWRPWNICGG